MNYPFPSRTPYYLLLPSGESSLWMWVGTSKCRAHTATVPTSAAKSLLQLLDTKICCQLLLKSYRKSSNTDIAGRVLQSWTTTIWGWDALLGVWATAVTHRCKYGKKKKIVLLKQICLKIISELDVPFMWHQRNWSNILWNI